MDSAMAHNSPSLGRRTKPLKAYQFVATVEEQRVPLQIDCLNDMEASLMALRLVSREFAVEVWSEGALIYLAPAIGQHGVGPTP